MNIYDRRKEYIDKVGKQLINYLQKGYLIFDEDNEIITNVEQRGFGDSFGLCINGGIIYYSHEEGFDNGYYTPLKELKQQMSKFKIVDPNNIISLKI